MIFQYSQINKTTEVLNDLVKINNDRIAGYQLALNQSTKIDSDLEDAFNKIIYEGICYKQQLIEKIKQLDGDIKNGVNIQGKIYKAWMDLKITFAGSTQKAIIASWLFNEEIAFNAYRAALSENTGITGELYQLIAEQKEELKKNFDMIKNYHDARHIIDYSLMYFS